MGLSGRKSKQRIGKDPRNLSWADDASRFGQAYLEKFGWDASKGLGVSGEGRTSAIKASQKLDMLGIGMRHQGDLEGGIAWRQNRDFEDLLRRLNDGTTTPPTETTNSTELLGGSFHKAREPKSEDGDGVEKVKTYDKDDEGDEERDGVRSKKEKKKEKKKKRKANAEDEKEEVEEQEGLDRKERKKKRKRTLSKDDGDDGRTPVPSSIESEPPLPRPASREAPSAEESGSALMDSATVTKPTAVAAPVPIRAPPRSHRARIIAAKRMAASNSTALAEILGIPSSSSSSMRPSAVASPLPDPALASAITATASTGTTTSNATATPEAKDLLQIMTTSSQSVSDYFRVKLNAKAHGERQARPTLATDTSLSARDHDGDGRAGLGLGFAGLSRMPPPDSLDEEPARGGIGASSLSMFATMFMPRQPTTNAREENTATEGVETTVVSQNISDCDDNPEKSEKMRAKEERRRKKGERRRKRAEAAQVDRVTQVVDVPVDGTSVARSKKKHRELEPTDGLLEGSDGREATATKKRKKDKKSSKHRGLGVEE